MVDFTLEDDPMVYRITFDYNELCDAELLTNTNLFVALANWPMVSCREMRALLYALLKPQNTKVLLQEAGTLLTGHMPEVIQAITTELIQSGALRNPPADNAVAEAPDDPAAIAENAAVAVQA